MLGNKFTFKDEILGMADYEEPVTVGIPWQQAHLHILRTVDKTASVIGDNASQQGQLQEPHPQNGRPGSHGQRQRAVAMEKSVMLDSSEVWVRRLQLKNTARACHKRNR